MPTILDKIRFNYDGVWSDTHNLMNVVLDRGMYEEMFVTTRSIIETGVKGNNKPLYHGIEESPIQFNMTIAFSEEFTDGDIDSIIRWLFPNNYKPMYFEGREDRVFMCQPVDSSSIIHDGLRNGFFTITMRCDSSNLYSQYITTPLATVSTSSTITINCDSHYDIYPEISLKKIGAGSVTIESLDDGGNIFSITDLASGEDIYVNCEKEIIETDIIGEYRYENIIGDFPMLVYGTNRMKITGTCEIQFRYKNKYKF